VREEGEDAAVDAALDPSPGGPSAADAALLDGARERAEGLSDPAKKTLLTLVAVAVFSLYVISNQLMQGRPAVTLETPLDGALPFWAPAEIIYMSVYLFLFLPVVHVKHMEVFKRVALAFYAYNLACIAFMALFPVKMVRPHFEIADLYTWGVAFNYAYDPPYNNFPSLHVSNAMFAGWVALRLDRPVGLVALAIGLGISVSTLLVKQHWVADVVAGNLVAYAAYRFIVAPAVPAHLGAGELAYPRRNPMILLWIYTAIVAVLAGTYMAGWRPFEWPLPGAGGAGTSVEGLAGPGGGG
jgi:membrane-associated phospholipid phosphatase